MQYFNEIFHNKMNILMHEIFNPAENVVELWKCLTNIAASLR